MAQNMQELARRMKSIESTEHITNAMRLVSSSKYKKAKNVLDKTANQLESVCASMEKIIAGMQKESAKEKGNGNENENIKSVSAKEVSAKTAVILITSEKGLCGGFNANLIKETLCSIEALPKESVEIFAVGSKGCEFFTRNGYEIIGTYDGAPEKVTFAEAKNIAELVTERVRSGEVTRVLAVYTKYVNSLKQEAVTKQLVPVDTNDFAAAAAKSINEAGKSEEKLGFSNVTEIEFSPSAEDVLEYMTAKYFELTLFKAIIESAVCEHAARRTAMENATDNANEMLSSLSLTYNRVRQAAITNEIIEIVSGAEPQM